MSAHLEQSSQEVLLYMRSKLAALKMRMRAHIPADFLSDYFTGIPRAEYTPFAKISKVKEVYLTFNAEFREELSERALSVRVHPSDELEKFIEDHKSLRRKMVQAQVAGITDEKTTIYIALMLLRNTPRGK